MAESSHLRSKAEQALRLARDNTDQVLARSLIEDAARYLERAEAIDLIGRLKQVAAGLGQRPRLVVALSGKPACPAAEARDQWPHRHARNRDALA
jgi:hypothetical protein